VLLKDDGVLDPITWVSVLGLVTSSLSLSKTYTEYSASQNSSPTSPLFTFVTAFIATGGRILVSCLMAMVYDDYNFVIDESATWRIFLPVSTAIGIQITLFLSQLCFNTCRKANGHNCLCLRQNKDSYELRSAQLVDRNSTPCSNNVYFSKHSDINEIENICTLKKQKYQNQWKHACLRVSGIQSLLYSITVDGHSHFGLWSSACYAAWALWIRLHFYRESLRYAVEYVDISTAALTFAMLSYTMNAILVMINDQHRRGGLLVSMLFIIYPIFSYIMASFKEYNYHLLSYNPPFYSIISILNPIVIVAGLVILANIIS
ncbi:unnamed protein product, partial [Meganyctiphanes norvegica]